MKVPLPIKEAIAYLIVVLLLLSSLGVAFGWDYYPASYNWSFQNYSYLGFNQAVNFTEAPLQGVPYNISLVGYWNMNEGSGTVAHDLSGNGNNGAVYGAEWVDGKYGKALFFDGTTGNYVDCETGVKANTGLTVSAWIKANNVNKYQSIVFKTDATSYAGVFQLRIESNNNSYFLVTNSSNTLGIAIGPKITAGQWYHVVGVYNGYNVIVYVNTVASAPAALTGTIKQVTSKTWIGIRDRGTSGKDIPFDGIIDDVHIHNRAISASEVTALYTMGPYAESPSPNPTASPAPSQTPQPTASLFPIETAVIAAAAIAVIIAVFAFAFKKGYITIEVIDEENPQDNSDDYTI